MPLYSSFRLNLLAGSTLGLLSGLYIFLPLVKELKKEQDCAETSSNATNEDTQKWTYIMY